jgi:hypothetical protein
MDGYWYLPFTFPFNKGGERLSAVDLFPAKKDAALHNLTAETNVLVTGILFHTKSRCGASNLH